MTTAEVTETAGSETCVAVALRAWECLAEGHATGDFSGYLAMLTDDYEFYMPLGDFRGHNVGRERATACCAEISGATPRLCFHPPYRTLVAGDTVLLEWEDDGTLMGLSYKNRVAGSFDVRGDRISGYREYLGDINPQFVAMLSRERGTVTEGIN